MNLIRQLAQKKGNFAKHVDAKVFGKPAGKNRYGKSKNPRKELSKNRTKTCTVSPVAASQS